MKRHLLDFTPMRGIDSLGEFPLLLKRTAAVRAVYRQLLRLGSFPVCGRQVNVIRIPQGLSSSSNANKVFERLESVCLSGVFPTKQFAYQKVLAPVIFFCVGTIHFKVHGEWAGPQNYAD